MNERDGDEEERRCRKLRDHKLVANMTAGVTPRDELASALRFGKDDLQGAKCMHQFYSKIPYSVTRGIRTVPHIHIRHTARNTTQDQRHTADRPCVSSVVSHLAKAAFIKCYMLYPLQRKSKLATVPHRRHSLIGRGCQKSINDVGSSIVCRSGLAQ